MAIFAASPLFFTVTLDSYKLRCLLIAAVFYDSLRQVRRRSFLWCTTSKHPAGAINALFRCYLYLLTMSVILN